MAIELLMACQAIDLLQPLTSTPPLQAIHDLVRQSIAYVLYSIIIITLSSTLILISLRTWDKDRFMSHDIEQATRIIKSGIVSFRELMLYLSNLFYDSYLDLENN